MNVQGGDTPLPDSTRGMLSGKEYIPGTVELVKILWLGQGLKGGHGPCGGNLLLMFAKQTCS